LLVQAGTGTGKSLGYLVPALAHGERSGRLPGRRAGPPGCGGLPGLTAGRAPGRRAVRGR
ncbi:hypothetical protein ACWDUG_24520, partial [Streptomyces cellulosae]